MALGGTLKCSSPSDIFLLLKSSDFIAHDLSHAFDSCSVHDGEIDIPAEQPQQFDLILRKWYDLHPSMEFRCFVRNRELVGICQRDYRNYYSFLFELQDILEEKICDFFEDSIQGKFPDDSCKANFLSFSNYLGLSGLSILRLQNH